MRQTGRSTLSPQASLLLQTAEEHADAFLVLAVRLQTAARQSTLEIPASALEDSEYRDLSSGTNPLSLPSLLSILNDCSQGNGPSRRKVLWMGWSQDSFPRSKF